MGKRKSNIVSIASLKEKQEAKVAFIRGDSKSLKRLQDMGLTPRHQNPGQPHCPHERSRSKFHCAAAK